MQSNLTNGVPYLKRALKRNKLAWYCASFNKSSIQSNTFQYVGLRLRCCLRSLKSLPCNIPVYSKLVFLNLYLQACREGEGEVQIQQSPLPQHNDYKNMFY